MPSASLICGIYWEDREEPQGYLETPVTLLKDPTEKFALSKIQIHSQETKGSISSLEEHFLQQQETVCTEKTAKRNADQDTL